MDDSIYCELIDYQNIGWGFRIFRHNHQTGKQFSVVGVKQLYRDRTEAENAAQDWIDSNPTLQVEFTEDCRFQQRGTS